MCTKKTPKKTQRKMEKIESDLRMDWLNHELDFVELALEAQELVQETKKSEKNGSDFENWREYLRVKCLVDEKVKNTWAVIISVEVLLISILSCFFSIISFENDSMPKWYVIGIGVCFIVFMILTVCIVVKSYKKYPQERAFYELLLYYADEISKPVVTENVSVESSTNNSKYIFRIGQLIKRK